MSHKHKTPRPKSEGLRALRGRRIFKWLTKNIGRLSSDNVRISTYIPNRRSFSGFGALTRILLNKTQALCVPPHNLDLGTEKSGFRGMLSTRSNTGRNGLRDCIDPRGKGGNYTKNGGIYER